MPTWYYHAIRTPNGLQVTVHAENGSYPLFHVVKYIIAEDSNVQYESASPMP